MREAISNPRAIDPKRYPGLARTTERFLRDNPAAAAALAEGESPAGFNVATKSNGDWEAPEFYRYERASGQLPVLATPRRLVGMPRKQFINRLVKRLEGAVVPEPMPRVTLARNSKLNKAKGQTRILSWSLPAGYVSVPSRKRLVATCPAASRWCATACYAKKGRYNPNTSGGRAVHAALIWRLELFRQEPKECKAWVLEEIRKQKTIGFRIHPSGDFFNLPYINWWISIIRQAHREISPDIWFWFYTRCWWKERIKKLPATVLGGTPAQFSKQLLALKNMDHVVGWASVDPTMKPLPPGWRKAWVHDDLNPDRRMPDHPKCPSQLHDHAAMLVEKGLADPADPTIKPQMKNMVFGKH